MFPLHLLYLGLNMVGNLDREATIEETASVENEPGTLEDDNKVTQRLCY